MYSSRGGYRISERGGGGGVRVTVSTKMQAIRAHVRDVFSLFMKFGGPQKNEGGGVLSPYLLT